MSFKDPEVARAYHKAYREAHREQIRANSARWRVAHPERKKELDTASRARHPETSRRSVAAYAKRHPDRVKATLDAWRDRNAEHIREYNNSPEVKAKRKEDRQIWRKTNVRWNLTTRLRKRLDAALKAAKCSKSQSVISLIGCTPEFLIQHLEDQFIGGMSWDNRSEWHIDHIRPCASFNLSDAAQQQACFHYTNLQPLWAKDNRTKNARLNWQPSLEQLAA